jgi:hypothetical protein
MRNAANERLKLTFEQMSSELSKGGTVKVLRARPGDASTRFLLRVLPIDWAGATYLELSVRNGGQGPTPIIDFYDYMTPGPVSVALRHGVRMIVGEVRAIPGKPDPAPTGPWAESLIPLADFAEAVLAKEVDSALSVYDTLPRAIREDKFMMSQRVALAQLRGDEIYLAALEDLLRLHPDEPNSQLMLLDALTLRKQFERVVTTLETFERDVVADPFMTTLRAVALGELGRKDEVIAALENAILREPDFLMAWAILLGVHTNAGDDQQALELVERSQEAGVDWSPLCGLEGFEAFCHR